ncbi:hypothetical protein GCM10010390_39800 [Streptomyces mordarskii]|uniref:Uncharacterized protein n=1 Tax=Streptomyces mordarskii TaxID=1226758 RepID=A0ABP3N2L4_9ACTN
MVIVMHTDAVLRQQIIKEIRDWCDENIEAVGTENVRELRKAMKVAHQRRQKEKTELRLISVLHKQSRDSLKIRRILIKGGYPPGTVCVQSGSPADEHGDEDLLGEGLRVRHCLPDVVLECRPLIGPRELLCGDGGVETADDLLKGRCRRPSCSARLKSRRLRGPVHTGSGPDQ